MSTSYELSNDRGVVSKSKYEELMHLLLFSVWEEQVSHNH